MATKKTFNTPSDIRAKALKNTPPLELHDDEGNVVGRIDAPLLWSDEIVDALDERRINDAIKLMLGDDYEAVKAAGWTIGMISAEFVAYHGVSLGESPASTSS
jgi:hypothetical protein